MRMCVFACVLACVLARIRVRAQVRVRARMRVRACPCMRAFVCACECGRAVPSASIFARVVRERACACVRGTTVWARLGAEWALRGPAVLIARPAAARARLRIGATGFRCRARLPQAEPSAAAPSRRDGLRDIGTRPWSTPPAPSTSSAATAAPPTTTTSGRAPTEVRGRTPSEVHWVGTTGVLTGY
jgi:hypothetical protein